MPHVSNSPRTRATLAMLGIAIVFVELAAFSIGIALHSRSAARAADEAIVLSEAYGDATSALEQAEVAILRGLTGRGETDFAAVFASVQDRFTRVSALGDAEDRALIADLTIRALPAWAAILRFQGTGDPRALPDPSLVAGMRTTLEAPAAARRQSAELALAALGRSQRNSVLVTTLIVVIASGLGATFVYAFRRFVRQHVRAEIEVEQLREAVGVDSLTHLGNQRAFEEALSERVAQADRCALAVIDVDDFKLVNDQWGHDRGDEALRAVARTLAPSPARGGTAFRIGGDEFALVLPGQDGGDACATVTRMQSQLALVMPEVTLSAGVAELDLEAPDGTLLRGHAEAALYNAKRGGKNNVRLFDVETNDTPVFSSRSLAAVREILRVGEIGTAFQPIWDLRNGRLLGAEALSRPATSNLAGPGEAFQVAARIGQSHALDVICVQAMLGRAPSVAAVPLLFINLSPYSLVHSDFSAASLATQATAAGRPPSSIVIEVTEESSVAPHLIGAQITKLHAAGFRTALDDVGAGNAGLQLLRVAHTDFIKVDRDVTQEASSSAAGAGVLRALLAFARETGTEVIAEGVDTIALFGLVRRLAADADGVDGGVHAVQGFLLGRPAASVPRGPAPWHVEPDLLVA